MDGLNSPFILQRNKRLIEVEDLYLNLQSEDPDMALQRVGERSAELNLSVDETARVLKELCSHKTWWIKLQLTLGRERAAAVRMIAKDKQDAQSIKKGEFIGVEHMHVADSGETIQQWEEYIATLTCKSPASFVGKVASKGFGLGIHQGLIFDRIEKYFQKMGCECDPAWLRKLVLGAKEYVKKNDHRETRG